MRIHRVIRKLGVLVRNESGVTLIETLVALGILATIAVPFLSGQAATSKAISIVDEQATVKSLAQSQMEWVKNADYVYDATTYSPAPISGDKDYINYSVTISAEPLHSPDDGIQKITIAVDHSGRAVMKLEGYKVDR